MNIYKFEITSKFKSIIAWSISLIVTSFLFLCFFPIIAEEADSFTKLLDNFPPEFLAAFGMAGNPFSSMVGYLGFVFAFVHLMVAIQASSYGFAMLTKEEADLTADFLLSKPVSRLKVYLSKLFAAITSILITNVLTVISIVVFINMFKDGREVDWEAISYVLGTVGFISLFFLLLSILISVFMKKIKSVIPFSLGVSFLFYTLAAFSKTIDDGKDAFYNPFQSFDAAKVSSDMGYEFGALVVFALLTIVTLAVTIRIYLRKNISSV